MSIPASFPYPLNQVVEIPLEQIIPNPDQPRRSMRQEPLETLSASMKAKGQLTEAKVRPLTEAERVSNPGVWVMLVGGHRRRLAALRNGFKTLKCTVHDITPEDTHYQALMDNDHEAMDWWDWDIAIERESKIFQGTQDALAARLDKGITKVKVALRITKTLNPAARALVDENLQKTLKNEGRSPSSKNKAFLITEENLLVLAGLEDPDRVQQALQVVLDDYLTTDQAQKLVEHMQAGEPVETFSPHKPVPPKPKAVHTASHPDTPPELSNHPTHHPSESHANGHHQEQSPFGETLAQPSHAPLADSEEESAKYNRGPQKIASAKVHAAQVPPAHTTPAAPESDEKPGWFTQWLVGIKFISQLRSKVKKGESLTTSETILAGAYKLYSLALKPAGKRIGRFCVWVAKGCWDALKKAFGKVFGKTVEVVLPWVIVALLVWGLLAFFHFVVISPWHWVEHKVISIFHHEDITPSAPTPVPTPPPVAPQAEKVRSSELGSSQLKPKTPNSSLLSSNSVSTSSSLQTSNSTPLASYQPSISFNTPASPSDSSGVTTLYDPKLLEQEIKAVRDKGRITAFAVLPDEGMTGDLAVSRTQDATDPDKYTLIIDGDKKKIINLATNTTNLVINYKSTDPMNIFNSTGGVTVFYEDVLYLHTDEIDVETKIPSRFFQLTLVGAGAKNALTFQCGSADDLKHLVSGLEYFIRNSRLGHDTALAGMPYLNQGLWLDRDSTVLKLWTNSPAWNAVSYIETAQPNHITQLVASQQVPGLQIGDHLWSVGKATKDQQEKKDFEKALSTLPVTLFVASDADWIKANIAKGSGMVPYFRPKLRKVVLGAS